MIDKKLEGLTGNLLEDLKQHIEANKSTIETTTDLDSIDGKFDKLYEDLQAMIQDEFDNLFDLLNSNFETLGKAVGIQPGVEKRPKTATVKK